MAEVRLHQMVKIIKRGSYFEQRAQIVALPKGKDKDYRAQIYWSLETFRLGREDFVVLPAKKARFE